MSKSNIFPTFYCFFSFIFIFLSSSSFLGSVFIFTSTIQTFMAKKFDFYGFSSLFSLVTVFPSFLLSFFSYFSFLLFFFFFGFYLVGGKGKYISFFFSFSACEEFFFFFFFWVKFYPLLRHKRNI